MIGSSNLDYWEDVDSMKINIEETDPWGIGGLCLHYKFEVITRYLSEDGEIYPNSCFLPNLNHFQFLILVTDRHCPSFS